MGHLRQTSPPFSECLNTSSKVSSRLIFWIYSCVYIKIWSLLTYYALQVLDWLVSEDPLGIKIQFNYFRKLKESLLIPFEAMYEAKQ